MVRRRYRSSGAGFGTILFILAVVALIRWILQHPAAEFAVGTLAVICAIFWLSTLYGNARERGLIGKNIPYAGNDTVIALPSQKAPAPTLDNERRRIIQLLAQRGINLKGTIMEDAPQDYTKFRTITIKSPLVQMHIRYKGSDDVTTDHDIDVKSVSAISVRSTLIILFINAFCHTAQEERPFRIDHIVEAVDGESGEVLWDITGWLFMVIGQGRKRRFKSGGDDGTKIRADLKL